MADPTPIWRQLQRAFRVSSVMEIFERMGWHGLFAASTLHLTNSVAEGGLGFSSRGRGAIHGVATVILYLFPVVGGGLANSHGLRRVLLVSTGAAAMGTVRGVNRHNRGRARGV